MVINDGLAGQVADTQFMGWRIQYFPRLDSTMDAARTAALAGAVEGMIVLAGEQAAGRGRLKREWLSPQGCLAFSAVLYPKVHHMSGLVMAVTLAVVDIVTTLTSVAAEIKWPNDVLVKGKKISGILVETGLLPDSRNYAVIGIGLNVNLDPAVYPEIREIATSMSAEASRELSHAAVLRALLARLEHWYKALLRGEPVFETWRAGLTTLGQEIQVLAGEVLYEGVAEDVSPDGALMLRLSDGRLVNISAGDVTLKVQGARNLSAK